MQQCGYRVHTLKEKKKKTKFKKIIKRYLLSNSIDYYLHLDH